MQQGFFRCETQIQRPVDGTAQHFMCSTQHFMCSTAHHVSLQAADYVATETDQQL